MSASVAESRPGAAGRLVRPSVSLFLLYLLPLASLLVPQGTIERSFVREGFFALFALVLGLALMARLALRPELANLSVSAAHPWLAIFVLYVLLFNPLLSVSRGNELRDVLVTTIPFGLVAAYYAYAVRGVPDRGVGRHLEMWVVAGVVIAGMVVFTYFMGDRTQGNLFRATILEGQHQALVLPLLVQGPIIALTLLLGGQSPLRALGYVVAFALGTMAILVTVTRALAIALVAGALISLALTALLIPARRKGALFVTAMLTVGAAAAASSFGTLWSARLSTVEVEGIQTVLGRVDEIRAALAAFADAPLLGQGFGFRLRWASPFDLALSGPGITLPHNHGAFFLATCGILGSLLYYGILADMLYRLGRMMWRQRGADGRQVAPLIALFSAVIGGILFTLTSTTYSSVSYNLFLAFALFVARNEFAEPGRYFSASINR